MRVVQVDPQSDPRWAAFVTAHPDGLVYHHPASLRTISSEYHRKPICLLCEDEDGQVRGVLPLLRTRGLPFLRGGQLTGRRLSSLPRTPVAGPLALDKEATSALLRAAVERVKREQGGAVLQLKVWPLNSQTGHESIEAASTPDGLVRVPWRLTYTLELTGRPEDIRFGNSRNHGRIKWAVNKATRMGVRVRRAETEDDLRAWYSLYLDSMRLHAVPPRPYRFFKASWDFMRPRGLMRLLLAEQVETDQSQSQEDEEGQAEEVGPKIDKMRQPPRLGQTPHLLAGSIFLMLGRTEFYAFNGSRRDSLSLRPNDAILWQAIHDACAEGYRYFDFGEVVEDNHGLAEFKGKWGAEPHRLYRYYYPAPKELEPDSFQTRSRARELVNAAWSRLPLRATALLGDWINSYL